MQKLQGGDRMIDIAWKDPAGAHTKVKENKEIREENKQLTAFFGKCEAPRGKTLAEVFDEEPWDSNIPAGPIITLPGPTITLTETQLQIEAACQELASFLVEKNRKYGNSAIKPVRCFSRADALEQINVRMDDKISRIMSGQADEDEDVEWDLAGYIVLKRVAKLQNSRGSK